jgi:hypothetical protein
MVESLESANATQGEATEASKHQTLAKDEGENVELIQNKFSKNVASPFVNQQKSWDDEEQFKIPVEIQKGITQELGFLKPSKI